jgi:hypothetical protein
MTYHDNVVELANAFIEQILTELTEEQVSACRVYIDSHPDSSTCPTHDYCDSNQLMLDAFHASIGRRMDVLNDDDHALSSAAWDLARTLRFSQHWIDTAKFCEWSESGVEVDDVGSSALACGQHASESGYSLCEGIAYADGAFVTKDEAGVYVAPIGNHVISGTLETCELFVWLRSSRHNFSVGGKA